jgi:hypothetical protein
VVQTVLSSVLFDCQILSHRDGDHEVTVSWDVTWCSLVDMLDLRVLLFTYEDTFVLGRKRTEGNCCKADAGDRIILKWLVKNTA